MDLYSSEQVYQLDRLCIQLDGQPSEQLMLKAANVVWNSIQQRWPEALKILVFAGPGNNGGDAYAVAKLAVQAGLEVNCIAVGDHSRLTEAAQYYRKLYMSLGGKIQNYDDYNFQSCDAEIIVDGLLGIGFKRTLDNEWQSLIRTINQLKTVKVSIDIPSGLNADTGNPMPCAIEADMTVSFIGRKIGSFISHGPDYCGELVFDSLGVSTLVAGKADVCCSTLSAKNIDLPKARKSNSFKNQFGHVLVVGGDRNLSGAARLAGMAALKAGSGLVSLCVHPDNYQLVASAHAELMVSDWNSLTTMIEKASVIVIGPGLGQSKAAIELLHQVSNCGLPLVIDADALQVDFLDSVESKNVVLTPHPGEASRLLSCSTFEVQQDRLDTMTRLTQRWPFVSVLKGSGTLIGAGQQKVSLCHHGHAGMASAGMGDVLAGLTASYIGQGLDAIQASRAAVLVHALAAEKFAELYDANSLIASDVIGRVASIVKEIRLIQNVT